MGLDFKINGLRDAKFFFNFNLCLLLHTSTTEELYYVK